MSFIPARKSSSQRCEETIRLFLANRRPSLLEPDLRKRRALPAQGFTLARRGVGRIGLDRQRFADQVTLDLVAGFSRQERELLGSFDALGGDRQGERAPEANDGTHDRG